MKSRMKMLCASAVIGCVVLVGCAGRLTSVGGGDPRKGVEATAEERQLRFLVVEPEGADDLAHQLAAALRSALVRSGIEVVLGPTSARDIDARLSLDVQSAAGVVRGSASAALERSGVSVDVVRTPTDIYGRGRFADAVARLLADRILESAKVHELALQVAAARSVPANPVPAPVSVENRGAAAAPFAATSEPPPPLVVAPPPPVPVSTTASPASGPAPVTASAPAALGLSGAWGKGIGIELLAVGAAEGVSNGRTHGGFGVAAALQFDLGPRWALRFPVNFDVIVGETHDDAFGLSVGAGILHRWRSRGDQRWIPYLGAGAAFGAFGARRTFLGLPLVEGTFPALVMNGHIGYDWHGSGGGADDPNLETEFRIVPQVWVGVERAFSSWFSLDLGASYIWIWGMAGQSVHVIRELVGVKFNL